MRHKIVDLKAFYFLIAIIFSFLVAAVVFMITTLSTETAEYTYAAFIKKQMCTSCIPLMIFGLLFSLFGLFFFKKMGSEVIENWMIIVWFSYCIIFVIYIIATVSIHYMDIKNEDYITYTGEFEKDHTRDFVFLDDENSTRLNNRNETFLESGHYSGTIIYSQRTKYVLSYSLNNGK